MIWLKSKFTDFLLKHPFLAVISAFILIIAILLIPGWFLTRHYGLDLTPFLSPCLVLLGGLVAVFFAVRNNEVSGTLGKAKATVDLLLREETDAYLLKNREIFLRLIKQGDLAQWASLWRNDNENIKNNHKESSGKCFFLQHKINNKKIEDNTRKEEYERAQKAIRVVINKYEMVAIGINNNVFSEKVYNEWIGTTLVKEWRILSPLIQQLRIDTNNPKLYLNFEQLAERLSKNLRI